MMQEGAQGQQEKQITKEERYSPPLLLSDLWSDKAWNFCIKELLYDQYSLSILQYDFLIFTNLCESLSYCPTYGRTKHGIFVLKSFYTINIAYQFCSIIIINYI
jgi:hypothetical protein